MKHPFYVELTVGIYELNTCLTERSRRSAAPPAWTTQPRLATFFSVCCLLFFMAGRYLSPSAARALFPAQQRVQFVHSSSAATTAHMNV
jgi:hypothetical protein